MAKSKLVCILRRFFIMILVTLPLLSCNSGSGTTSSTCNVNYWVSTSGNESANGSFETPFLTIKQAQDTVRQNALKGQCPITVNILSGTYTLSEPLVFSSLDSGSTNAKVTYMSDINNKEPVVISGGVMISNFNCDSSNMCNAKIESVPTGIMPRQFYVNNTQAIRARSNYGVSVNADYIRVANGYEQIIPQALTHPELIEAVTVTQWKMMRCPIENISGSTLIMKNPCWNNANSYPIPWNFQLLSWLENAPEFVTSPGMWYFDPYTNQLTYYNDSATPPQKAVLPLLESLVVVNGTSGNPVSDITFKGLQFSYATWLTPNTNNGYVADQSGNILLGSDYESNLIGHQKQVYKTPGNVSLSYAQRITFDSNQFTHLGAVALDLGTGSQNNSIINNIFTDISSSAIQIGGVSQTDMRPDSFAKTANNLIKNNLISYTGTDYYDSAAIYIGFTTGTKVIQNTISHTPWSGIAIGWGWGLFDQGGFPGLPKATPQMWGTYSTPTIVSKNEISSNKFEYFLEKLWDGGAIYTNGAQGPDYANGLLISLNLAQNKRSNAGSNIYYTDGGSKYITLSQNVSLNDPVGTVDFGPCLAGSSIDPLCALTGTIPYGADMGGCLPVGYLSYENNYLADTIEFFGPDICKNSYVPPYPVNLNFSNNVPTSSISNVPNWIILQAGAQMK